MDGKLKKLDGTILLITLVLCTALAYMLIERGMKQHRQNSQQKELLQERFKELNLATNNLERLQVLLHLAERERDLLNRKIPDETKIGEFINQLDALIKEKEILLASIEPLEPEKEGPYTKIPVRLVFNGSFLNVYSLISEIERLSRMVVMKKMSVIKSKTGKHCKVDLTVNIFKD